MGAESFARALTAWYARNCRDLPWRRTSDPYRIWISEVMLQQTRVQAVMPYYGQFVTKYPDVEALARAPEQELLAMWAGLGYYSRARNMHRAAKQIAEAGRGFPNTYEEIRALPGVGDYTAAAIASIAFGLPHAVLDGNVMRVMARITDETGDIRSPQTRRRLTQAADQRLDPSDSGSYNQAVMELGATLCVPGTPKCLLCPVRTFCGAHASGRERELPVKSNNQNRRSEELDLLIVAKDSTILLHQRPSGSKRLAGFWELPSTVLTPSATLKECLGAFQHGITNTTYVVTVHVAEVRRKPADLWWIEMKALPELPLSTVTRKALRMWNLSLVKSL